MDTEEQCWFDDVGDQWEAEGTVPGRIWEFHFQLAEDLQHGGMVETTEDVKPGVRPYLPNQVKRVLVKHKNGEEITMPGMRALVVTRFHRIVSDLC